MKAGTVYLVGAGPGDPELLTLKGQRILACADSVLYDHLASDELLALAPAAAERLYVGKKKSEHAFSQDEISRLLIERARAGKTVVRLKGGDPYLFGRGGEEVEALAAAGIPFEVVPGVTSPLGVAAYCGVPLTHREHTSVVTMLTGHEVDKIEWAKVAGCETLVIFMGLTTIAEIVERLIAHGRSPETPALAVRWATRPDQHTVTAPLRELPAAIREAHLKPPATIVIGDVVSLRAKLDWFEKLPLFGKTVLITRAAEQAGTLSATLRRLGACVIEWPTIAIGPAADYGPVDRAIEQLDGYDWIIFTSVNGVRCFLERLDRSRRDLRSIPARVCTIGPATRRAVEALHLKVDLTPPEYVAESLMEAFAGETLEGKRVLLPRAAVARDLIPTEFTRRGAHIDVVEVYRTVMPDAARTPLPARPDWVTFTSSSTVHNFVEAQGVERLRDVSIASIGPVTSETVRSYGLTVAAEARPYTVDGLVSALLLPSTRPGRYFEDE
ncbi:MAG: uroporphyrinogen-III C-methyltransferase [Bryobacterales bacterium]|nr:uroporphyrinogen-III C-methyltransferase [Bryobacterales bacterium]